MMGVDGTLWVELRHCGDTSKTLWVGIGCYDGCRWDAMGRTKTLWLTHLRHCEWRYDVMMVKMMLWVELRHLVDTSKTYMML